MANDLEEKRRVALAEVRAKRQAAIDSVRTQQSIQPGSSAAAALTHRRPVEQTQDRPYTPDKQQGANLPRAVRGALTAGQGLTFGMLDELAGAAGAMGQSGAYAGAGYANQPTPTIRPDEVYSSLRDVVRGGVEQFQKESPGVAMLTEAAGGLPFMAIGGPPAMTAGQRIAQGLRTGAAAGGLTGIGSSEAQTPGGILEDALFGAVSGGVTGSAIPAVTGVVGGGARRVAAAAGRQKTAESLARERLAILLNRNLPYQFQEASKGQFAPRMFSRMSKLGPDAPLAAVGPETVAELDVLANMPGSTRQALNIARRQIQGQRGPALVEAAEGALDARGLPFRQTLQGLVTAKQQAAKPFYDQLQNATVTVDDEILFLLNRAKNAVGGAKELAQVAGTELPDFSKIKRGDQLPFSTLDTIKKSLWDIAEGARGNFGEATERSRAYNNLRRNLIDKLDRASPKDKAGQSIYRTARETFESGAQLETAMRRGADSMSNKVDDLRAVMEGMEAPELEAFRIGAAQALRDKLGTQAGQTQILNLYKEPTMKARLQVIFGNDFNKFKRAVLQQEQIKEVERAGRGSQTFGREAQAADMGQFMEAMDAAQAAKTGNVMGLIQRGAGRLAMPEAARNELSKMLLKRNAEAMIELQQAQDLANALARARTRRARGLGAASGATTASQSGE
jgi:hypothetical protein